MTFTSNPNYGILRTQVQPGDILIKLNGGDIISNTISWLSKSGYVHGGIAGQNASIYDINGGLPSDDINGNRLLANIYRSDLNSHMKQTGYHVWRCRRQDIANIVHIQAAPFVALGVGRSWGYNIRGALGSVMSSLGYAVDSEEATLDTERAMVAQGASFASAALQTRRSFFCTEWIVWLYLLASCRVMQHNRHSKVLDLNIRPYQASPGALVVALKQSYDFTYQGQILPDYS